VTQAAPFFDPTSLRQQRSAALARNWWALVLRGVLALIFGAFAFLDPGVALGSLVLVFGIYLLVDGVFAIVAAGRAAAHHERWGLLLLEGVLGVLIGLLAVGDPLLAVTVWITVLAAWAIVTGVLMIVSAFRLHTGHGNWWMGLGGAASVIWGALLFVAPLIGAVVLTIWLGAYAVIFGVAMIALGLRLRRAGAV
jgi:uncharacterized membrane protein HdeD (DUF308 family)